MLEHCSPYIMKFILTLQTLRGDGRWHVANPRPKWKIDRVSYWWTLRTNIIAPFAGNTIPGNFYRVIREVEMSVWDVLIIDISIPNPLRRMR
jgi:hypothetical protein